MKLNQKGFLALMRRLGVVSWDCSPPDEGLIRFVNRVGDTVCHGRCKVILVYRRGIYKLGWALRQEVDLPRVSRSETEAMSSFGPATQSNALKIADRIGTEIGADLVFDTGSMLLALFEMEFSDKVKPTRRTPRTEEDTTTSVYVAGA